MRVVGFEVKSLRLRLLAEKSANLATICLVVDMRKLIDKSNITNKRAIEQKKREIAVYP
jgi:hypothetical protein